VLAPQGDVFLGLPQVEPEHFAVYGTMNASGALSVAARTP